MSSLSISAAWDEAKAILARDGSLCLTVAMALIVLPQIVLAVVGSPAAQDASTLSRVVYVAVILVGIVAQIALSRLAIGPAVTVREAISQGLVRLLPVFLVVIVSFTLVALLAALISIVLGAMGVIIIKGPGEPSPALIVLLLILGTLAFAILQLVFPIAAVETGNPIKLATRCWQLARGHYLRLVAFVVVVLIGLGLIVIIASAGLGSLIMLFLGRPDAGSMSALLLGLIAGMLQAGFTVVTAVMLARIYVQLARSGSGQAGVPNSGT